MNKCSWKTHTYAALRHPKQPKILLQRGADGWQLPYHCFDEDLWFSDVHLVTPVMSAQLDAPLWSLRQIHFHKDTDRCEQQAAFELELLQPELAGALVRSRNGAPERRWAGPGEIADLLPAGPEMRKSLLHFLAELEQGVVPAQRPPWARPGWLPTVRGWIEAELQDQGRRLKELEQVKQWGISAVWRVLTDGPDYYFKAPANFSVFVNEAQVTRELAGLFPGHIPDPVSIDAERNWMLMQDIGEMPDEADTYETRIRLLNLIARIQVESAGLVDQLLQAGCLDRRRQVLAAQIPALLADPQATAGLSPEELEDLNRIGPDLPGYLEMLAGYAIPDALVHGDLHPGNVTMSGDRLLIFDWTDACIAHPFVDGLIIITEDDPHKQQALLLAYLESWTDYEPLERLQEAWRLGRIFFFLHQAVSYQHIVASLEPASRKELDFTAMILKDLIKEVHAYNGPAAPE